MSTSLRHGTGPPPALATADLSSGSRSVRGRGGIIPGAGGPKWKPATRRAPRSCRDPPGSAGSRPVVRGGRHSWQTPEYSSVPGAPAQRLIAHDRLLGLGQALLESPGSVHRVGAVAGAPPRPEERLDLVGNHCLAAARSADPGLGRVVVEAEAALRPRGRSRVQAPRRDGAREPICPSGARDRRSSKAWSSIPCLGCPPYRIVPSRAR